MLWSSICCLRVLDTAGGTILLGLDVLPKPNVKLDFPGGTDSEESACNAEDPGSIPGLGRYPGEGNDKPTPVSLPGESHGQRSLAGYTPWGHKESDTTERLTSLLV